MRASLSAVGLVLAASLTACAPAAPLARTPDPTPTAEKPFVVATTEAPTTLDPAGVTSQADAVVALAAFRRLMVVHPQLSALKPDLATDCLFTSASVYQCELPKDLVFANGHALTASDVAFSVQRAHRLAPDHAAASLFDSLRRVEIEGDQIVRFVLRWPDPEFGYALAAPTASIVDEELYDPDALRPNDALPEGSGPYRLVTIGDGGLGFEKNGKYFGPQAATIRHLKLLVVADSAAAEQAINDNSVDAVWRGLSDAALERLRAEADAEGKTASGFTRVAPEHSAVRVTRLVWNPQSKNRKNEELRKAVALSLQADRTLASLVPTLTPGSKATFPTGGVANTPALGGDRLRLSLGFAGNIPGLDDEARMLRDRIEAGAGVSVKLVADNQDADLFLTDEPAMVNTAVNWLRPYTDNPLAGSTDQVEKLVGQLREENALERRTELLASLQKQAAIDLTVIPIAQGTQSLYLGSGVSLDPQPFGPGFQLGLWSFRK